MPKYLVFLLLLLLSLNVLAQPAKPKIYFNGDSLVLRTDSVRGATSNDSAVISWKFKTDAGDSLLFEIGKAPDTFKSDPKKDTGFFVVRRPPAGTEKTTVVIHQKKVGGSGLGNQLLGVIITWNTPQEDRSATTGNNPPIPPSAPVAKPLAVAYAEYYDASVKDAVTKSDIGFRSKDDRYEIDIYFDQFGNSLYSSIPTGISNKYHYKVHIIHPKYLDKVDNYVYSVNQTSGSLSDVPLYYNGNTKIPAISYQAGIVENTLTNSDFDLLPTTDDLAFEIGLTTISNNTTASQTLKKYTIKMSPYYYGSFDVGLIYSQLGNPAYTLVNLPSDPTNQTVKVTDDGKNVFISVLYTVYWSPINAIFPQSGKNKNIRFNAFGRSYLDDEGSFLRKIYPCLGISLSDKLLTNWFLGLNFEPVQGFGLFAGANIRKVNTFNLKGLVPGETIVNQDQFNYYQNTQLKAQWAFGFEVDISAFIKILGNLSNTAP